MFCVFFSAQRWNKLEGSAVDSDEDEDDGFSMITHTHTQADECMYTDSLIV